MKAVMDAGLASHAGSAGHAEVSPQVRRALWGPLTDLALLMSIVVGFLAVLFRDLIFPERFSYDALRIQRIAQGRVDPLGDDSYSFVGNVYAALHLQDSPMLAALFGYAVATAVLLLARSRLPPRDASPMEFILVAILPVLNAAFFGTYSKDIFVFPIIIAILLSNRRWQTEVAVVMLMVGYGLYFRSYWLIVVVIYVGFRIALPRLHRRRHVVLVSWAVLSGAGLAIYLVLGTRADHFRIAVNSNRIGVEDTATMILPFVNLVEPFGGLANNVVAYVSLVAPWQLVRLGGGYYLVLALVITLCWGAFAGSIARWLPWPGKGRDVVWLRAISLVCAFLVVQALFEPDYGSYLRHLTPLLVLVLYSSWSSSGLKWQVEKLLEQRCGCGTQQSQGAARRRVFWRWRGDSCDGLCPSDAGY